MKRMTGVFLLILMICSLLPVSNAANIKQEAEPFSVTAQSAVLMDQESGQVLFEKNAHEKRYPASVTKIMSLLLFMEAIDDKKLNLSDRVKATREAVEKGGSQIWLKEGEQMTVDELLRATAIGSANDACTALAIHLAGSEAAFVRQMNERAKQLGMHDTVFENCTGLDDDTETHLTTAYDIALMSRALLAHEKIQTYTTVWMDSLRGGKTQLVNTNKLVRFYNGTTGLKTGTTNKAGCCVSASARRDGMHLIAVVLHAPSSNDRFSDAKMMLDWGFASFESVTPDYDKTAIRAVPVRRGIKQSVEVQAPKLQKLLLKTGEKANLQTTVALAEDVFAPVEKGQELGSLTVSLNGKPLAEYPLCAAEDVRARTLWDAFLRLLSALRVRA